MNSYFLLISNLSLILWNYSYVSFVLYSYVRLSVSLNNNLVLSCQWTVIIINCFNNPPRIFTKPFLNSWQNCLMKSQNTAIKIKSLIAAQVVRNKIDWWWIFCFTTFYFLMKSYLQSYLELTSRYKYFNKFLTWGLAILNWIAKSLKLDSWTEYLLA